MSEQQEIRPATVQKVSAVLRKIGTPKGEWLASGRVSGWGSWTEGAQAKAETTEYYICRFCHASTKRGEGHRFIDGRRYSNRCSSGSWRVRKEKTGRVLISWHIGNWNSRHDRDEWFAKIETALTEAGLHVERVDNELVVTGGEH